MEWHKGESWLAQYRRHAAARLYARTGYRVRPALDRRPKFKVRYMIRNLASADARGVYLFRYRAPRMSWTMRRLLAKIKATC